MLSHPVNKKFWFKLLIHEDGVVLNNLVEITDALDTALEEL